MQICDFLKKNTFRMIPYFHRMSIDFFIEFYETVSRFCFTLPRFEFRRNRSVFYGTKSEIPLKILSKTPQRVYAYTLACTRVRFNIDILRQKML